VNMVRMEPLPVGVHCVARRESDLGPPNAADFRVDPASESETGAESGELTVATPSSLKVPAGIPIAKSVNYYSSWAG